MSDNDMFQGEVIFRSNTLGDLFSAGLVVRMNEAPRFQGVKVEVELNPVTYNWEVRRALDEFTLSDERGEEIKGVPKMSEQDVLESYSRMVPSRRAHLRATSGSPIWAKRRMVVVDESSEVLILNRASELVQSDKLQISVQEFCAVLKKLGHPDYQDFTSMEDS